MYSTGMIRKLDSLGRVVIPAELRERARLKPADEVEIYLRGTVICIEKFRPGCVFCGSQEDLMTYSGQSVCRLCSRRLFYAQSDGSR